MKLRFLFLALLIPVAATAQPYQSIWDGAQKLDITAGSAAKVDGSAVTQPVSAASLPLPSGAAESAKQDTGNTSLASIDGKITAVNTGAVVISSGSLTCNAGTNLNTSALATSAKQDTIIGHVDGIETVLGTIDADTGNISTQIDTLAGAIKAEDVASAGGDPGMVIHARRTGTPANQSGTDGDYEPLQISAGRLWTSTTVTSGTITTVGEASDVRQTDAARLNATVVGTGTFAVQEDGAALTALQLLDDAVATTASAIPSKGFAVSGTDGTNARVIKTDSSGELQVDVLSMPTTTVTGTITASNTAGDVAHDTGDSGNPVKVGGKAISAMPTAVTANDRSHFGTDLYTRILTTHIDPAMQVHKAVNVTTTQTGSDVWSPASGKKIAVTSVIVSSYDTTGCRALLWFGDNADTTYTAGTDQLLLPFSTVPSATIKPGIVYQPPVPVFCTTADRELHLTTDAACDLDIVVEGYEY